ncbi:hypothetical protein V8G54_036759 [Vigna mungo]|uniref:Integrase catalytic domain-containing protein n=1 Tax=Vigna mungo TaxID=3915 RepID=A0AAQ3MI08_VIGMU
METSKLQAVMDWPGPTSLKQLRGFLGLTGYSYAAFEQLKLAITQAPVLAMPDFSKPFVLETDASGVGIGAVLSQEHHPIVFFSKKLSAAMQKQSTYTREFYAITEAIAKFRHYLLGHKFVIRTDQKGLKSLMEQAIHTPEQQKWLHKLLGYDFTIEYKPGKDNIAADSLSRFCFMAWSQPNFQILHAIREVDNLLLWKGRLVIPQSHVLIQQILHEFHSSLMGGHAGFTRTLARIAAQFYWKGMNKDVQQFVQACLICQQAKMSHTLPAGLLQPLPIPEQIWEDIAMDFITGLPPSNGFTVILVVVDRLSKYGHFSPLKADYSSKSVVENFVKSVVKLHGILKTIVSDRDKVFLSHFWQQLFKLSGTSLHMSTAYHPPSDGQSKSLNKCLEMYLRCFTYESPKDWAKLLPWAEYWYNTSYHHSYGMTPFKIVYGRDPLALVKYNRNPHDSLSVQDQLLQRDVTISKLKVNLYKAQQYMKKQADKKRRFMELQIGDLVLVKLQPYRQHTIALRKNQKLCMRFFGPFPVIQRISPVAYKLLLPPTTKIHPVFHCSQLKPCKGNHSQPYVPLPTTSNDLPPVIQPVAILKSRVILRGMNQVPQVLVQWEGLEVDNATWEDQSTLQQAFPNLNLEDKVGLNGGGIVTHVERAEESNVNTPHQGESGPCLNSSVVDHPLGPATDHRFGKLLLHQLANQMRASMSNLNMDIEGLAKDFSVWSTSGALENQRQQ